MTKQWILKRIPNLCMYSLNYCNSPLHIIKTYCIILETQKHSFALHRNQLSFQPWCRTMHIKALVSIFPFCRWYFSCDFSYFTHCKKSLCCNTGGKKEQIILLGCIIGEELALRSGSYHGPLHIIVLDPVWCRVLRDEWDLATEIARIYWKIADWPEREAIEILKWIFIWS